MQVSARILGQDYGLTAEEMNRVLVKLGFLSGMPGDYNLTSKAKPYATVKEFHRGTGGYAHYNKYWTTRKFDESIKDVLDVTADLIQEVRDEIKAERTARSASKAAAKACAETEFLAKNATEKATQAAAEKAAMEVERVIANWKKAGKISLLIGGVALTGYGIYKMTPHVKKWWCKRKHSIHKEKEYQRQVDANELEFANNAIGCTSWRTDW